MLVSGKSSNLHEQFSLALARESQQCANVFTHAIHRSGSSSKRRLCLSYLSTLLQTDAHSALLLK